MIAREFKTDLLVVGGGGAGLFAAIEALKDGVSVTILSKGKIAKSGSTINAYNAIQAPLGNADENDNAAIFSDDIMKCSGNLANPKLVNRVAKDCIEVIHILSELGVPFDKDQDGKIKQSERVGGMTYPRVLSMETVPLSGPPIVFALKDELPKHSSTFMNILEDTMAIKLICFDDKVFGCVALNIRNGELIIIKSKAVILATGGLSENYLNSYCPRDTTGDGQAIAFRIGAKLVDMEFVHFMEVAVSPPEIGGLNVHAPAFYSAGMKAFDINGKEVDMEFEGSHASRNTILNHIKHRTATSRGGLHIDLGSIPLKLYRDTGRFEAGRYLPQLDISEIEIGLGPLFNNGGIQINEMCESSIENLYAVGDTAGGFVGARYFGATGVIFALTSGLIAGREASKKIKSSVKSSFPSNLQPFEDEAIKYISNILNAREGERPFAIRKELQNIMCSRIGIIRNYSDLKKGVSMLEELMHKKICLANKGRFFNTELVEALQTKNMLELSLLTARASLMREESRGDFLRDDFPQQSDQWTKNIVVKTKNGECKFELIS